MPSRPDNPRSIIWVWATQHHAAAVRALRAAGPTRHAMDPVGNCLRRLETQPDGGRLTRAQLRSLEDALADHADVDVHAAELLEILDEAHRLAEAGVRKREATGRLELVLDAILARTAPFLGEDARQNPGVFPGAAPAGPAFFDSELVGKLSSNSRRKTQGT